MGRCNCQAGTMRRASKFVRLLLERSHRSALVRHHIAAGVEHTRVLKGLDCQTVIDIGANRGQFALAARHCFPQATIVSFEPLSGPAERFRHVLARDPGIALHQVAVGAASGEATIHVSGRDDSSSLLQLTTLQGSLFPGTAEVRTETVRVGRLSEFVDRESINPPALLKLDVQGYELETLKGCQGMIDCFLYIYAECSFVELYEGQAFADEVIAWLHEREFHICGAYNVAYDAQGIAIQADLLFKSRREI